VIDLLAVVADDVTMDVDYSALSPKELGERIQVHLARFEADPQINEARERPGSGGMKLPFLFEARAFGERKYVYVQYKLNHGFGQITKDEAARYLRWLDQGNVGRHQEALRA
jgi:hypothetical protein